MITRDIGWARLLPDYAAYPESFRRIVPFLAAALIYHHANGDLHKIYPASHPIFVASIFTPLYYDQLKNKVILTSEYCHDTKMSACGIPAVITIAREIQQFKAE